MKKSGEIVSSVPFARAPYPPLARSPFPNGEGYDTRTPLFSHYQSEYTHTWRKRITTDKAFPDGEGSDTGMPLSHAVIPNP